MSAPVWQPGTLYLPGDIVQPISVPPATGAAIPNAGFESGDVDWTKSGSLTIVNEAGGFAGDWFAKFVYAAGAPGSVRMAAVVAVTPGRSITASCMVRATGPDQTGGDCNIIWVDGVGGVVSVAQGNQVNTSTGAGWKKSTVTGVCPAGAVSVVLQGDAFALNAGGEVAFDDFRWDYVPSVASSLLFKAVQTDPGTSGDAEPTWPATLGLQVVDNEVTWEAVNTSRVVWTASPVMVSGATEPAWPTVPGAFVADGTISWECASRHVAEAPRAKVVAIMASKVFAVDRDIVRFSATANPLDWTSEQDAGFLPTGLQQANSNNMAVLAPYRGNLTPMNANCFQMWQVDPDPAAMALLDQMDGIGSTHQEAAQPVGNELFYLSQQGVRTVGIAGASTNLQAGDVGMPIDPIVQARMLEAAQNGMQPLATYYPGAGQYWLAFNLTPQVPPQIVLWGNQTTSGGVNLDAAQTFNSEIASAISVVITGYYTPLFSYTYPPTTDPLDISLDGFTRTPVTLALSLGGGEWGAAWPNALPDGEQLVTISIDGGADVLAAIWNGPGS